MGPITNSIGVQLPACGCLRLVLAVAAEEAVRVVSEMPATSHSQASSCFCPLMSPGNKYMSSERFPLLTGDNKQKTLKHMEARGRFGGWRASGHHHSGEGGGSNHSSPLVPF